MDSQLNVFDNGVNSRTSDPETSKAAAKSVDKLRASQARVLAMFRMYGDMTDEQLAAYLHDAEKQAGFKLMSPSGVRSRRSELSKPNMDRIEEIAKEVREEHKGAGDEAVAVIARARLIVEGVKSPLWDTGARKALASGRMAIVWGLAR